MNLSIPIKSVNLIAYSEICFNMTRILVNIDDVNMDKILEVLHLIIQNIINYII